MSEVITVRIDKTTKEKIRKHKIDVSKIVRSALQEEIRKREEEKFREDLREAGRILRKIPEKEIVRMVRESRDENS